MNETAIERPDDDCCRLKWIDSTGRMQRTPPAPEPIDRPLVTAHRTMDTAATGTVNRSAGPTGKGSARGRRKTDGEINTPIGVPVNKGGTMMTRWQRKCIVANIATSTTRRTRSTAAGVKVAAVKEKSETPS